ncbi:uncharacterized protein [Ptychodera flava]|uniref:uncharacterized protein n=1 Tax=Ptychodera flava TaxID=63121 RepID=UPI00396A3C3C
MTSLRTPQPGTAGDSSWRDHKEKGDFYLKIYQCVPAVDCYNHAIEKLERDGTRNDLAGLHCSRSLCYCRIAEGKTGTQRTSLYNLALKDAERAISLDGWCFDGYMRKAASLLGLNQKSDAIVVLRTLIKLYKDRGINFQSDHSLLSLLRQCKYYNDDSIVKCSLWFKDCRFSKHISVVDPGGAGLFQDLQTPLQTLKEASLLLRPGRYLIPPGGLRVQSHQNIDIIGDTREENETVTIEASDSFDGTGHSIITVNGGSVQLANLNLLQSCSHESVPGIVISQGGKCLLNSVQGVAAAGVFFKAGEGSECNIRNCKLKGALSGVMATEGSVLKISETLLTGKVGLDISAGSQAQIQRCTFSKCGYQAILSHSNAGGIHVFNSKFVNNGHESDQHIPGISLSAGQNIIRDCEILKSHGQGVCVDNGCQCILQNCLLKGNPTAVRIAQSSHCKVLHCRMVDLSIGVNAVLNLRGSVFMKGNTIMGASMAEVMVSTIDAMPTMEGRNHRVKTTDASKDRRTRQYPGKLSSSPPKFDTQPVDIKKSPGRKFAR